MLHTENSVPRGEATANDFMQIRAALVRRLGSANAALVWSRVYYRANPGNPNAYEQDGVMWWRANREIVAAETGLNPGQARRTLEALEADGFLIAEKHHRDGNYDQTKSYRCNVVDSANDWAPATNEDRASAANVHRAPATNVPSTKTIQEVEDKPYAPDGAVVFLDVPVEGRPSLDDQFEQLWQLWPRSESKQAARKALVKALKLVSFPVLLGSVEAWAYGAVQTWPKDKIPYFASWLNGQRWTEEPPKPDTSRAPGQQLRGGELLSDLAGLGAMMDQQTTKGITR